MARQQPNGKWRADVTVNKIRKQKLCDSQEEAEKLEAEFKQQIIDGKPREKIRANSQITLKQAFENCLRMILKRFQMILKCFSNPSQTDQIHFVGF